MWHNKSLEEIYKELASSIDGLSNKEAEKRQKEYGYNVLPKAKHSNLIEMFLKQFLNPIIFILIIAIILSLIIGELMDALFIFIVIMINAILGTIQEFSAEKNAEKLQNMIQVNTTVLREGREIKIPSKNLVVGDIVSFESGDKIPADVRLIESQNFIVDESILTGESEGKLKENIECEKEVNLADIPNMAFAGTIVLSGRAKGIVVKIAGNTEIGLIANKVQTTVDAKSPLVIRIEKFSKQLSTIFVIFALILSIVLYYKGYLIREIFFSVIALTVSAIPEGLSTAMTIVLSISSSRMAKENVIVKNLNAVESLGSCTVIASDKTGTLTKNEQTAKIIYLPWNEDFGIPGAGYIPNEPIIFENETSQRKIDTIKRIAKLGMLNNEASLIQEGNEWKKNGDSIDIGFITLGYKLSISVDKNKIISSIPYESKLKYSAIFFEDDEDVEKIHCTIKGATEKVIDFCNKMMMENGPVKMDKEEILRQNQLLSSNGYRVIAIAEGTINKKEIKNKDEDFEFPNMTFLGLIGFVDPIKEDTLQAIEECKKSGIKVYMITGDHPLTAYYVANQLNIISDANEIATGDDIEEKMKLGNDQFDEYISKVRVCARTTPLQKLAIVESLKRQGEYIAVTGDGVNDSPSLKSANLGVAMGTGSDVAKDTSDMIIADDNFSTIITGTKEGRKAYKNIRNVIYLLLSTGFSEIILFVLSIICDLPIPLVAIQFLWLNLITNGIQSDALAFEKNEDNVMREKVKKPEEGIFDSLLIQEILLSAIVIALIAFGIYFYVYKYLGMDITHARTYVMLVMVYLENIHIFNCRSETKSAFKISFKNNYFVTIALILACIIQFLIVQSPVTSKWLELEYTPWNIASALILFTIPVIVVMELFKFYKKKKGNTE